MGDRQTDKPKAVSWPTQLSRGHLCQHCLASGKAISPLGPAPGPPESIDPLLFGGLPPCPMPPGRLPSLVPFPQTATFIPVGSELLEEKEEPNVAWAEGSVPGSHPSQQLNL